MGNSALAVRPLPETERTLAFGSISGTYAAVGTPLAHPSLLLILQNQTDVAVSFSWDGVNSAITLQAGVAFTFDEAANKGLGGVLWTSAGTQIYAKTAGSPASGALYISTFYGANFNNL